MRPRLSNQRHFGPSNRSRLAGWDSKEFPVKLGISNSDASSTLTGLGTDLEESGR